MDHVHGALGIEKGSCQVKEHLGKRIDLVEEIRTALKWLFQVEHYHIIWVCELGSLVCFNRINSICRNLGYFG